MVLNFSLPRRKQLRMDANARTSGSPTHLSGKQMNTKTLLMISVLASAVLLFAKIPATDNVQAACKGQRFVAGVSALPCLPSGYSQLGKKQAPITVAQKPNPTPTAKPNNEVTNEN